jgi:tetratricopeptide (TPR) repeat protein
MAEQDKTGALASYQESLDVARRLAINEPNTVQWQHDLSLSLRDTGDILTAVGAGLLTKGDLAEALAAYREGLNIQHVAAKEPDNLLWPKYMASNDDSIGDVLQAQGKLDEALTAFRESLAIRKGLVASG